MKLNEVLLRWHKLDPRAIIPTKEPEAAGLDIYTIEENFTMAPHSQHLFKTGLAVAIEEGWWLKIEDRGSTGSKGLHIHCGIVDNDYRGEIFVCIKNDNPYAVKFTDEEVAGMHEWNADSEAKWYEKYYVYPIHKAIAQVIPILQPIVSSGEATDEEWEKLKVTKRGEGKLGSTGK